MPPLRRRDAVALGATASASAAFYAWYTSEGGPVQRPRLVGGRGALEDAVRAGCPSLTTPYRPTPWAVNAHVQTVLTRVRGALAAHPGYARQLLTCPATGGVAGALDWFRGSDSPDAAPAGAPVLLVLHGLGGDSREGHCRHACAAAAAVGWRAAVLVHRGGRGLPLTSAALSTAAATGDVRLALASVADRFPGAPLLAVGYSMGGLTLTKALAEADAEAGAQAGGGGLAPPHPRLAAAVIISSPFDPAAAVAAADAAPPWSPSRLYGAFLEAKVRAFVARHADALATHGGLDVAAVLAGRKGDGGGGASPTAAAAAPPSPSPSPSAARPGGSGGALAALLDSLVAVGGGPHPDLAAAAAAADAAAHIPAIRTPTLFITSSDDPLVVGGRGRARAEDAAAANPSTLLAVTARGGHLGFLTGPAGVVGASWAEGAALEFLRLFAPAGPPLAGGVGVGVGGSGGGARGGGGGGAAAACHEAGGGPGGAASAPALAGRGGGRPSPYARPGGEPAGGGGRRRRGGGGGGAGSVRTDHLGSPVTSLDRPRAGGGGGGGALPPPAGRRPGLPRVAASAAGGLAALATAEEGAGAPSEAAPSAALAGGPSASSRAGTPEIQPAADGHDDGHSDGAQPLPATPPRAADVAAALGAIAADRAGAALGALATWVSAARRAAGGEAAASAVAPAPAAAVPLPAKVAAVTLPAPPASRPPAPPASPPRQCRRATSASHLAGQAA